MYRYLADVFINVGWDGSAAEEDPIGVELQSQRLEKKIELEDRLQNLDLRAPAPAPKDAAKAKGAPEKR